MGAKEHITEIYKYSQNDILIWLYSTDSNGSENKTNYYMLHFRGKNPVIEQINNVMDKLQEYKFMFENVNENSVEYLKFLAIKDYAEELSKKRKR